MKEGNPQSREYVRSLPKAKVSDLPVLVDLRDGPEGFKHCQGALPSAVRDHHKPISLDCGVVDGHIHPSVVQQGLAFVLDLPLVLQIVRGSNRNG